MYIVHLKQGRRVVLGSLRVAKKKPPVPMDRRVKLQGKKHSKINYIKIKTGLSLEVCGRVSNMDFSRKIIRNFPNVLSHPIPPPATYSP